MADIVQAYDALAPEYESYSAKKAPYLEAVDALVTAELAALGRPITLLDVGSGDGRRLAKILAAAPVEKTIAIEPSAEMAALCRERLEETGKPFEVHVVPADAVSSIDIGKVDAITALWNVLGHIAPGGRRVATLSALRPLLAPGGVLIFDVNNRHNAASYGVLEVAKRVVIDALAFDESRGDARYDWTIGDKTYAGFGHLFTPGEVRGHLRQSGWGNCDFRFVDYATGAVSAAFYRGQIFCRSRPS